jgi:hypothetical protein
MSLVLIIPGFVQLLTIFDDLWCIGTFRLERAPGYTHVRVVTLAQERDTWLSISFGMTSEENRSIVRLSLVWLSIHGYGWIGCLR